MTEYYEVMVPVRFAAKDLEEARLKAASIKVHIGDEEITVSEVRLIGEGVDGEDKKC